MNESSIGGPSVSANPTPVDFSPMTSLVASSFTQIQNTIEKGLEKNEKVLQEVRRTQCEMQKHFRSAPQGLSGQHAGGSLPLMGESSGQSRPIAAAPASTISRAVRNKTDPKWNKFLASPFTTCLPLANAYHRVHFGII
jgi:hypothetical protein